mmetsp:Transcript_105573/g.268189  ORF Transcript_105573/g.268189 Transcript_105573/m.268189 type:complete len:153 (+) Transcript_105573:79-537(+)
MDPGASILNSEVFKSGSMADKGMMMRSMRLTADSSGFFNSSSSRASPSHSAMATSPDQRRRRETHLKATTSSWAGSSAGFGGAATGMAAAGRSRSQPSLVATTNTLGNHYMHEAKFRGKDDGSAGCGHPATNGTWGFANFRAPAGSAWLSKH